MELSADLATRLERNETPHRMECKASNELTYEVKLKKDAPEKEFIDQLRIRNGNLNITMALMSENVNTMLN